MEITKQTHGRERNHGSDVIGDTAIFAWLPFPWDPTSDRLSFVKLWKLQTAPFLILSISSHRAKFNSTNSNQIGLQLKWNALKDDSDSSMTDSDSAEDSGRHQTDQNSQDDI